MHVENNMSIEKCWNNYDTMYKILLNVVNFIFLNQFTPPKKIKPKNDNATKTQGGFCKLKRMKTLYKEPQIQT